MPDKRLIDANGVIAYIDECIEDSKEERADARNRGDECRANYSAGEVQMARRIKRNINMFTPTIDAVEVVRCRECKYAFVNDKDISKPLICCKTKMVGTTDPDWFCAAGERKMDGGEEG